MFRSPMTNDSGVSSSSQNRFANSSNIPRTPDASYSSPAFRRINRFPEPYLEGNYSPERHPFYIWLMGLGYNRFVSQEVEKQVREPMLLGETDGREYRVRRVLRPEEFFDRIPTELALGTASVFPIFPDNLPLHLRFDWEVQKQTRHLEIWSPNMAFLDPSDEYCRDSFNSSPHVTCDRRDEILISSRRRSYWNRQIAMRPVTRVTFRRFRVYQPFNACPLYSGPAPSDLRSFKNPLYSQWLFADGGLGPFDYTQFPQLFDGHRPWLGCIIKPYEASHSPTNYVLAERVNVALAFVSMPNRNNSHIWPIFLRDLRDRASNLDEDMDRLRASRGPDIEPYWKYRPEGPSADVWEELDKTSQFLDAVRWTAAVQRILKEKDAFVQYFTAMPAEGLDTWSKSIVAREEQGALVNPMPFGDSTRVGVWIYSCQPDVAWLLILRLRVPIYVLHEVENHPDGAMVVEFTSPVARTAKDRQPDRTATG
ncbi:hypothetical protein BDZ89DRAFT_1033588 [Hymenopellis radicata]|nr:hypothetical protein BDZ89DRAFT_1033588 [Hymenopellis radicata]